MLLGYSVGNTGSMQMTALQHQQMRSQGMVTTNMGQNPMGQNQSMGQPGPQMGPAQLNMNQQIMTHSQQQSLLQQNATQVCFQKYLISLSSLISPVFSNVKLI